jgi:hypothetical protein
MLTRIATAAAALIIAGSAGAHASFTGIPSAPNAGPSCTKFTVQGHTFAINTTDNSANSAGRLMALNNAFLNNAPTPAAALNQTFLILLTLDVRSNQPTP